VQKLAALGEDLAARSAADALLRTVDGAGLVTAAYHEVCGLIEQQLKTIESPTLRFNVKHGAHGMLLIHTRYMLTLRLFLENMALNSASEAKLKLHIFRRGPPAEFGGAGEEPVELAGHDYLPWFSGRAVVWRQDGRKPVDTRGVVDAAIELLRQQLQSESS